MQRKLLTAAARTAAAAGGAAVLCLGGAHAALAMPMHHHDYVSCNQDALDAAISDASTGATIYLHPDCTYVLTSALPNIGKTLTIDGNGATIERSYAIDTSDFTILDVEDAGVLTLNDVNVRHGGGDSIEYAGAIDDNGELTVNGGTFYDNSAEYGAAIYIPEDGELSVDDASFQDNVAEYGGAIENYEGDMTVTHSAFKANTATDDYGGAVYQYSSEGQITDSTFTGNSTEEYGGAIYNDWDLTVTGSTFTGNQAWDGGAVYNEYDITLTGDTFTGNGAADGGAVYNDYDSGSADATVNHSTFTQNGAYWGGGIYNYEGTVSLSHAKLSHNSAVDDGGGIYTEDAIVTADSSTSIKDNYADVEAGGIYNYESSTVTLNGAHVTGNSPDNCVPLSTITGCTN